MWTVEPSPIVTSSVQLQLLEMLVHQELPYHLHLEQDKVEGKEGKIVGSQNKSGFRNQREKSSDFPQADMPGHFFSSLVLKVIHLIVYFFAFSMFHWREFLNRQSLTHISQRWIVWWGLCVGSCLWNQRFWGKVWWRGSCHLSSLADILTATLGKTKKVGIGRWEFTNFCGLIHVKVSNSVPFSLQKANSLRFRIT